MDCVGYSLCGIPGCWIQQSVAGYNCIVWSRNCRCCLRSDCWLDHCKSHPLPRRFGNSGCYAKLETLESHLLRRCFYDYYRLHPGSQCLSGSHRWLLRFVLYAARCIYFYRYMDFPQTGIDQRLCRKEKIITKLARSCCLDRFVYDHAFFLWQRQLSVAVKPSR